MWGLRKDVNKGPHEGAIKSKGEKERKVKTENSKVRERERERSPEQSNSV